MHEMRFTPRFGTSNKPQEHQGLTSVPEQPVVSDCVVRQIRDRFYPSVLSLRPNESPSTFAAPMWGVPSQCRAKKSWCLSPIVPRHGEASTILHVHGLQIQVSLARHTGRGYGTVGSGCVGTVDSATPAPLPLQKHHKVFLPVSEARKSRFHSGRASCHVAPSLPWWHQSRTRQGSEEAGAPWPGLAMKGLRNPAPLHGPLQPAQQC